MTNTNHYPIVDALGRLMAKKAELGKEEKHLKDALHDLGPGSYEGALFRATVGQDSTTTQRDAQAMRDKLWAEGFYAFVKAHEQEVPRAGSVRVVAKTGQSVAADKERRAA